jgi:ectoine hydroxylase-related dioxygenase (phytanoyl-CoA dioxygenase family)
MIQPARVLTGERSMLSRDFGYLKLRTEGVSEASRTLEQEGWAVLRGVLDAATCAALIAEFDAVYAQWPRDARNPRRPAEEDDDFRYEMLNRSAKAQAVVAHPAILAAIEPLLGEDCHVIANTCWRNPPRAHNTHGGGFWHIDAGPHVPHDPSIPWDDRIPYPVFAIGAHIYLRDCGIESGPTGVIPGSHKSGIFPPRDRATDVDLEWNGRRVLPLTAAAGDVALFVSDVWHRRLPTGPGDRGRYFLQAHYGRRDIAQRLRTTASTHQLSAEAIARAGSERERHLIGLHAPFFYDG